MDAGSVGVCVRAPDAESPADFQMISPNAAALLVAREPTEITAACWEAQDADAACSFSPPAPSADVHQAKGGGCYDNTAADGEDGGSGRETYISIIFFFVVVGGGVAWSRVGCCVEWDHTSPEACCCAANSVKIHSGSLNTKAIIALMWHCEMGGGGGIFWKQHLSSALSDSSIRLVHCVKGCGWKKRKKTCFLRQKLNVETTYMMNSCQSFNDAIFSLLYWNTGSVNR